MKKFIVLFLFLFPLIGVTACSSTGGNDSSNTSVTLVGSSPNTDDSHTILAPDDSKDMNLASYSDSEITPDLFPETSHYMHDLNMQLIYALKPSLDDYKSEKVSFIHTGFSNLLRNLHEPLYAINSLLQLDFTSTAQTLGRFTINSTAGILGVMDVAGPMGLKRNKRDFGQTLGVYGVPMGGFFVMPLYAQTTTRDISGTIVDSLINPVNYVFSWGVGLFISVSNVLMDLYDSYDFILATHETSLNSYETFKTIYLQNRVKNIDEYRIFGSSNSSSSDSDTSGDNGTNDTSAYDFDM